MTTHSRYVSAIVWVLVAGQMVFTVPVVASEPVRSGKMEPWTWKALKPAAENAPAALDFSRAQSPAQATARPKRVSRITPNRTVPRVDPVPLSPVFSETPTDEEIFRARIFPEPLVPVM